MPQCNAIAASFLARFLRVFFGGDPTTFLLLAFE